MRHVVRPYGIDFCQRHGYGLSPMSAPNLEVSFMPWAALKGAVSFGPVTFWPLAELDRRVSDQPLREHLQKYFACFVDHHGRPATGITICSHGPVDFRVLSRAERAQVRAAVDCWTFAVVSSATQGA